MDMDVFSTFPANIKVVGVGGGGNNAVHRMIDSGMKGVEFIIANTDLKSIRSSKANRVIQIGSKLTKGLGAGAVPEVGEKAAEESENEIREALMGADMIFLTAGMGGGTGTGATPVIARIAKELGILTVGIVTKPFPFEGSRRMSNAVKGIEKLKENVDSLIVILNQNLLNIATKKMTIVEAFSAADDVLKIGIQSISNIINIPGLINLDFADVSTIMRNSGLAHMGMGIAKGDERAINAARQAVNSPLLETAIIGANGLLINVTGGNDLSLTEIDEAIEYIRGEVNSEAEIIFGASIDENMKDEIHITLIATGLNKEKSPLVKEESLKSENSKDSTLNFLEPDPDIIEIPTILRRKKI
ncbi:cell division protein FtsZ [Clostridium sp. USBA 49]|jgi:cell division protein FtsZ|uniref:cell division protein FtsZ n=1 Tax=Clostridium sp. USBA 49 TaxID=1881060 RepID=UPI0009996D29|nr:cell division protein FtsZ [Clostridium sp. USBA 49]SKA89077.1 cell division protein FtsZ [Clostridium sp. USBA 49]